MNYEIWQYEQQLNNMKYREQEHTKWTHFEHQPKKKRSLRQKNPPKVIGVCMMEYMAEVARKKRYDSYMLFVLYTIWTP